MRKLFVLVFAVLCSVYTSSFAAEPFGLKIGEMKFSEFQKKVRSTDMGINSWSKGVMRGIPVEELNIEGLKDAVAIFNEDNILVGLLLTFNKSKFDSLNAMAKQNYQTVSSQIPYVGDKFVKYKDGDTEIRLDSIHMSFDMSMVFLDKSLVDAHKKGVKQQSKKKQEKENAALFGGK